MRWQWNYVFHALTNRTGWIRPVRRHNEAKTVCIVIAIYCLWHATLLSLGHISSQRRLLQQESRYGSFSTTVYGGRLRHWKTERRHDVTPPTPSAPEASLTTIKNYFENLNDNSNDSQNDNNKKTTKTTTTIRMKIRRIIIIMIIAIDAHPKGNHNNA